MLFCGAGEGITSSSSSSSFGVILDYIQRQLCSRSGNNNNNNNNNKMGSSFSTQARTLTKEQQDVKYLGDRMPFGDAELYEVYRAYFAMKTIKTGKEKSMSFLTSIGSFIVTKNINNNNNNSNNNSNNNASSKTSNDNNNDNIDKTSKERLSLLLAVEQKILPNNFGNRLYQTSFLRKSDMNGMNGGNNNDDNDDDDYTRLSKVEAFFDGLSNSTRRGGKQSLKILMDCCERRHVPPPTTPPQKNNHHDPFSSAGSNNFAYATTNYYSSTTTTTSSSSSLSSSTTLIEPLELVIIGYRVALAAAFLHSTSNNDDEHQDISRFFPNDDTSNDDNKTDSDTDSDKDTEADTNNNNTNITDNNKEGCLSNDPGLKALAESLIDFATKRKQREERSSTPNPEPVKYVDEDDVQEWGEHVAPLFASSLASFLHMIFFPNRAYPPTRSKFEYPDLASFESSIFLRGNSPLLFSLACMSPSLNGQYYRLYTAASDGLSFNRLQNALLGYGGPTLLVVQSGDSIFGAFTGSPWKESKDFYGNTDCFLFQLQPRTAVYRPTGKDNKFMYCNSFARSRGYDQQAHGIGFGGTVDKPRLFLTESFDDCWAGTQDLTFENGNLLAEKQSSTFVIDNLEVWGVGGTEVVQEALGARSRERDVRQANINKARKVDKAAFLDDFQSGLIESKAFAHRGQIRGRESACIDDEHLNSYKYPQK